MKEAGTRIAVCTFQDRVSFRFDLSREILIYDKQAPERGPLEKLDVSSLSPLQSLDILVKKGIEVVIVGGMQERYQTLFFDHHIRVIWGVIGGVDEVILACKKDALYPGIGRII